MKYLRCCDLGDVDVREDEARPDGELQSWTPVEAEGARRELAIGGGRGSGLQGLQGAASSGRCSPTTPVEILLPRSEVPRSEAELGPWWRQRGGRMAWWGRSSESRRTVAPSRSVRQRIPGEQIAGAKDPREQFRPARVGWRRYLEKRMEVRRRGAAAPSRRTRIEIIGEIGRAKASFDRILNFVKSVESDMYLRMEGVPSD